MVGSTSHNSSNIELITTEETIDGAKENGVLDWYVEGPGRRVGYDDLTAIDWIFEYAKERQRLRQLLASSSGLLGYFRQLLDASHVWLVLILTGIATGLFAAAINIAADWLGDIKTGFCKAGEGSGQFYLNKAFCCWGHDELAQCQDWTPWRDAMRISNLGGAYIVEYIFFIIYSVLFAACAAVLVSNYSIYAKQSGIPEIKTVLGGFVMRRFLDSWTLVTKALGVSLAVGSGLWVGKEGPLVHIACCCANIIMKPIETIARNEARKREVLSAAAAAGISVAFGAPIGGVLFSLEQLSYYFPDKTMWQSFVCAMIAAVTLQALNPFHTGKIVLFQVTYTSGWHTFELIPFILLGLVGGIYGGLFTKLNMKWAKFRRSTQNLIRGRPVAEVTFIATITAVMNFPNIFMRAQLSELVYYMFAECEVIGSDDMFGLCKVTTAGSISVILLLVAAAALGFILASLTFGLELPAGLILPSVAIGALYGRALGMVVELIHKHYSTSLIFANCEPDVPCITPGTYAIVGAASALAGVTRMTVSIVVIMFELTGALTYVLPIMIAVMLSKWIGDAFSKKGIYESWIQFNAYPFIDNRDDSALPDVPVSNIMTRMHDMTCLDGSKNHTVSSLETLLKSTTFRGFPVLSSISHNDPEEFETYERTQVPPNILLGYISRTELSFALSSSKEWPPDTPCYFVHNPTASPRNSLDLRPWMDQTPISLNANSSFQLGVNMFQKLGLRYLLFVDRGKFAGILTKKDLWWILNAGDSNEDDDTFVAGAGVLREEEAELGLQEESGLLRPEQDPG